MVGVIDKPWGVYIGQAQGIVPTNKKYIFYLIYGINSFVIYSLINREEQGHCPYK